VGQTGQVRELPVVKRRPQRRDRILREAIELFRRQGFSATGIDEIGAAAGISGPGVYRHFTSKQQLLEEAMRLAGEHVVARSDEILAVADGPADAIERLVAQLVEAVGESPALIAVLHRERDHLGETARATLDRTYRRYVRGWTEALMQLRPELSDREARAAVHGVLAMVVALVEHDGQLERDRREWLLTGMVLGALEAPRVRL
jgi:AcrR family transcriptional regulator